MKCNQDEAEDKERLKFMACITISGKYCKWMSDPDKLGEELKVYVIFIRNVQTFHVAVPFCIFISNI